MEKKARLNKTIVDVLTRGFFDENYLSAIGKIYQGVVSGDIIASSLVGDFKSSVVPECDPTWVAGEVASNKLWSVSPIAIYKKWCADTLDAEYKRNQPVDGIEGNDPVEALIADQLTSAFKSTVLANAFYGDKDSTTAGLSAIDGIFTQAVDAVNAGQGVRVTVATQTRAAMNTGTTTIDYLEQLIDEAPENVKGASDGIIVMTDAMAASLRYNTVVNKGINVDGQWNSLFGGLKMGEYAGIKVVVVPLQAIVAKMGATDLFYQKPYTALYTTESNICFGTSNSAEAGVADVKIVDDFAAQDTKGLVKFTLGAALATNDFAILY